MRKLIKTIFTGRNEVVAKVIFLHLSVIHSVHMGGCLPQCMLGYHTPQEQTHPLPEQTPWEQTPPEQIPPGADTPTPPGADTPPGTKYPPGLSTPLGLSTAPRTKYIPPGSRLLHTVNERPVRILLECILVFFFDGKNFKITVLYKGFN